MRRGRQHVSRQVLVRGHRSLVRHDRGFGKQLGGEDRPLIRGTGVSLFHPEELLVHFVFLIQLLVVNDLDLLVHLKNKAGKRPVPCCKTDWSTVIAATAHSSAAIHWSRSVSPRHSAVPRIPSSAAASPVSPRPATAPATGPAARTACPGRYSAVPAASSPPSHSRAVATML